MGVLCFTVDFDRDVNVPLPGSERAGSLSRGKPGEPRFSSSSKGAEILVDLLESLGIRGTFFLEAETYVASGAPDLGGNEIGLHGLGHEDLTGADTGIPILEERAREIISEAAGMVGDASGAPPLGFRAPYMRAPGYLPGLLADMGFVYDSSIYAEKDAVPLPHDVGGLVEIPAAKATDAAGKTITSYLWPMHEGKRSPSDYAALGNAGGEGTVVVATHTWHMVETRSGGKMTEREIRANAENTARVVGTFLDMGYEAATCLEAARDFLGRRPGRPSGFPRGTQ